MKVIELWQYTHWSDTLKKRVRTRYVLTDADAQARLVNPERVPGTRELRSVPESVAEHELTSAFMPGSTKEKTPTRPKPSGGEVLPFERDGDNCDS